MPPTRDAPSLVQYWPESWPQPSPEVLAGGAALLGAVGALAGARVYRRYFRRYPIVDALPPDVYQKRRWIKGLVTSVGDADNFRLYHTPGPFWYWPLKLRRIPSTTKALQGQTLHIRLAGVDAPEAAHFGRQAQPYSAEAIAWLKSTVEGRVVWCQLLSRDQYSRNVAIVVLAPWLLPGWLKSGKNVSLEMLKAGWATTYAQAGAEYGQRTKEQFQLVEAEAKAAKRGMWVHGTKGETPAEYKRRHARAGSVEEAEKLLKTPSTPRQPRQTKQKKWWWPF
ncbi:SNase-domain-containing protein [Auricularia subglabra TFB-10046 SS5]|nr:SNase-domain-containing protein [Auricularia subglabra TFB-10046 SS5]